MSDETPVIDGMRRRCAAEGHSWEHEPPLNLAPGDVMQSGDRVLATYQFCKWCGAERKNGRPL